MGLTGVDLVGPVGQSIVNNHSHIQSKVGAGMSDGVDVLRKSQLKSSVKPWLQPEDEKGGQRM